MKIPSRIHILGLASNAEAMRLAENEVRRMGRDPVPFMNIASPWDRYCIRQLGRRVLTGYMSRPSSFSCLRGHCHIVLSALEMGEQSVWVVEDDVRFFKDCGKVEKALAAAPKDADILILDPIYKDFHTEASCFAKAATAKDGWWEIDREDVRSTGDYMMSARAAAAYAEILSRGPDGKTLPACDTVRSHDFFPKDIKIYAASPNLSIQRKDESSKHMQSFDKIYERYAAQGVCVCDYAAWDTDA